MSAQIKSLEDDLEIKLFDRIGRRIYLTTAGEKLYGYAQKMKGMEDEIYSAVSNEGFDQGYLTIRIPETVATKYFPDIITRYHQEYPRVRVDCINCSDHALPRELNSGRIDLAFLMTDSLHMENVKVRYLKNEKMVLVGSPNHPLVKNSLKGKTMSLADLDHQTFLLATTD